MTNLLIVILTAAMLSGVFGMKPQDPVPVCPVFPAHEHVLTTQDVVVTEITSCYVTYDYFGLTYFRYFEVPYTGSTKVGRFGTYATIEYCDTVGAINSIQLFERVKPSTKIKPS